MQSLGWGNKVSICGTQMDDENHSDEDLEEVEAGEELESRVEAMLLDEFPPEEEGEDEEDETEASAKERLEMELGDCFETDHTNLQKIMVVGYLYLQYKPCIYAILLLKMDLYFLGE